MTPRITPAMTPKNVAMVRAFVLKNDAQPFLDGFKLYARFRKPDFMLFSSMVRSEKIGIYYRIRNSSSIRNPFKNVITMSLSSLW